MEKRLNIWKFLKKRFRVFGNKTAFVCGSEGVSYANLIQMVETGEASVRKIMPVMSGSALEQAMDILRNLRLGHIVVPLNSSYGDSYCQSILDELEGQRAQEMDQDIAFVLFTSGSTGKPKGAMLSHGNIIWNIQAIGTYFAVSDADKILIARPLMHCAVLTGELLFSLYEGLEIHLYDEAFMPHRLVKYMVEHKITTFGCTPTMLNLLKTPLEKANGMTLKNLIISGEVLSPKSAVDVGERFPDLNVYSVYGLTEASPRVSALSPADFLRKLGSIGRPIRDVELKLEDEKKCETEDGFYGRLFVKSPGIMCGYMGNAILTRSRIKGGWLDTGDIARRDGEGYYFILGRADNMIIRAGINIYPEEMEALLKKDERVQEVLYFAEKNDWLGTRICLKIAANIAKQEAFALCKSRLPHFAQPQVIEIVDAIGKTASGKVKRNLPLQTTGSCYSERKEELGSINFIDQVTPHNEFLFISCYYHHLLAAYSYFGVDKKVLLTNITHEITLREGCIPKIEGQNIQRSQAFKRRTGVKETVIRKSKNIMKECFKSLRSHRPFIIAADTFYLPYRETTYQTSHMQHYLLICGYDAGASELIVLDHMFQNSHQYSPQRIKLNQLRNGFLSFSKLFAKKNKRLAVKFTQVKKSAVGAEIAGQKNYLNEERKLWKKNTAVLERFGTWVQGLQKKELIEKAQQIADFYGRLNQAYISKRNIFEYLFSSKSISENFHDLTNCFSFFASIFCKIHYSNSVREGLLLKIQDKYSKISQLSGRILEELNGISAY